MFVPIARSPRFFAIASVSLFGVGVIAVLDVCGRQGQPSKHCTLTSSRFSDVDHSTTQHLQGDSAQRRDPCNAERHAWEHRSTPSTLPGNTQLQASSFKSPAVFAANRGQWDESVKFAGSVHGATVHFLRDNWTLALPNKAKKGTQTYVSFEFKMDAKDVELAGSDRIRGTHNYLVGNDPRRWATNVPLFTRVAYHFANEGIDIEFYDAGQQLEYDLRLSTAADLSGVSINCVGVTSLQLADDGTLVIGVPGGLEIRHLPPKAWLELENCRHEVSCRFRLTGQHSFGFEADRPENIEAVLVIDPLLDWSTYFGGSSNDDAVAIEAHDELVTIAGNTQSTDLPIAGSSPLQGSSTGGSDAYVARFDPTQSGSSQLVWSTYLGGSGDDYSADMALTSVGDVAITGVTSSGDLGTLNSHTLLSNYNGNGASFVSLIRNDGSVLLYQSYLQGSGPTFESFAIAVDPASRIAVVGRAESGLIGVNAYDPSFDVNPDAFLMVFDPSLVGDATLWYSTYLDGAAGTATGFDEAYAVTFESGLLHVAGMAGPGWVTSANAFDSSNSGFSDGFLITLDPSKLPSPATDQLVYCTYFGNRLQSPLGQDQVIGGAFTLVTDLQVTNGVYFFTGITRTIALPVSTSAAAYEAAAVQGYKRGGDDAFIAKLNPQAVQQLRYSTYLGGDSTDHAWRIRKLASRTVALAGNTASADFPPGLTTVDGSYNGNGDAFLTQLTWAASKPPSLQLVFSTFHGGSDVEYGWGFSLDGANYYIAGWTQSSDYPVAGSPYASQITWPPDAFACHYTIPAPQ